MGMTSQGQMALRRRVLCPRAETRSVVMGLQFTRALRLQQWFRPLASPSRAGVLHSALRGPFRGLPLMRCEVGFRSGVLQEVLF
jgi:hypothetical protein